MTFCILVTSEHSFKLLQCDDAQPMESQKREKKREKKSHPQ